MSAETASRKPSLADVLVAIEAVEVPVRRRQDLASAVNTVARLLGRNSAEIAADPAALRSRLKEVSPLSFGLSPGRWANVRSLLNRALELVRPMLPGRNMQPLTIAWERLAAAVPKNRRIRLLPLLRHLSARQIGPDQAEIGDLETFHAALLEDSLRKTPEATWSNLVWTWNRCVAETPNWPQIQIIRVSRRETYSLPWTAFPPSLKADVGAYLRQRAGHDDLLEDGPPRPARPETLKTRERQLRIFASALVHRGRDSATLRKIADLVEFDAFCDGLRFFLERNQGKTGPQISQLADFLKGIARRWVKADEFDARAHETRHREAGYPQQRNDAQKSRALTDAR